MKLKPWILLCAMVALISSAKFSFAASTFDVYARPDINVFSVKKNAAANGWQTEFRIQCTVSNKTKTTQEYGMWTCSVWQNLKPNNSRVTIVTYPCSDNAVLNGALPPGGSFSKKFSLDISPVAVGKELKLKIGFVPYKKLQEKTDSPKVMGTFWSNEFKIKVVE